MADNKRQAYLTLRTELEQERSSFILTYRDLNDFFVPRRGRFFTSDVNKGDRRSRSILNGEVVLSVREFENGMMSHMTSQARKWFNLTTQDAKDSESEGAKEWLSEVTEEARQVLSRSNFYNVMPKTYKDWGVFATAVLFAEEDFDNVIHFHPLPIGSYMVGVDEKGRVNQLVRDIRLTVRQVVMKFCERGANGEYEFGNVSEHVKQLWKENKFTNWVDVCHIVCPNDDYDKESINSKNFRFASKYFERGTSTTSDKADYMNGEDKMLRESGYNNFPVLSLRWGVNGEDFYGSDSPGWQALGDNKQVQLMEKRGTQAIEKMANPPMVASVELEGKSSSILPGGVTYVTDPKTGFYPAVKVDPRIAELNQKTESINDRLKRFFFVDLFRMLATLGPTDMTKKEAELRDDERLKALVAPLEQANYEFFRPLIDLLWEYMERQGRIPPPPESLAGKELKVEYVSVLAQAQKLTGLGGLERFVRFATDLATVTKDGTVLDKLDIDQTLDVYADLTSVPQGVVRSDEAVAAIRQGRAAEQQAQAKAAELAALAKGAKDLAGANLEQDSALKRIIDQGVQLAPAA